MLEGVLCAFMLVPQSALRINRASSGHDKCGKAANSIFSCLSHPILLEGRNQNSYKVTVLSHSEKLEHQHSHHLEASLFAFRLGLLE